MGHGQRCIAQCIVAWGVHTDFCSVTRRYPSRMAYPNYGRALKRVGYGCRLSGKGAPTQKAPTRGASTVRASTRGAPTEKASQEGLLTGGAPHRRGRGLRKAAC